MRSAPARAVRHLAECRRCRCSVAESRVPEVNRSTSGMSPSSLFPSILHCDIFFRDFSNHCLHCVLRGQSFAAE
jgi:hypothetical protein